MANVIITSQPVSLTAVPGQDSTFSVTASADFTPVQFGYKWSSGQTTQSIVIDPLISNNGNTYSVSVSALSGSPLTAVATVSSNVVTLTVNEDVKPFDTYDVGSETGRQRHLRLRLLGYI
jgi:hypothetical protein